AAQSAWALRSTSVGRYSGMCLRFRRVVQTRDYKAWRPRVALGGRQGARAKENPAEAGLETCLALRIAGPGRTTGQGASLAPNYFSLVSLYSTCLRATGSNFLISIFSGMLRLFLVVV